MVTEVDVEPPMLWFHTQKTFLLRCMLMIFQLFTAANVVLSGSCARWKVLPRIPAQANRDYPAGEQVKFTRVAGFVHLCQYSQGSRPRLTGLVIAKDDGEETNTADACLCLRCARQ